MKHILVIDSDVELTHILTNYLQSEHYIVTVTFDGETGIKKAINQQFDAIILDITLPQKNGFEVLKTLRGYSDTPVLILTEHDKEIDKLVGFEIGADDYLVKPCSPRELIARLKVILLRTHHIPAPPSVIKYHNIQIDRAKHKAFLGNHDLELTNTEFNILEMLMKSPSQAFSKKELTEYALGREFTAYDRSIDVHISNLRNKLGMNISGEAWLKTVRGFGYMFNA